MHFELWHTAYLLVSTGGGVTSKGTFHKYCVGGLFLQFQVVLLQLAIVYVLKNELFLESVSVTLAQIYNFLLPPRYTHTYTQKHMPREIRCVNAWIKFPQLTSCVLTTYNWQFQTPWPPGLKRNRALPQAALRGSCCPATVLSALPAPQSLEASSRERRTRPTHRDPQTVWHYGSNP